MEQTAKQESASPEPDIISPLGGRRESSDVWAAAQIAYELLVGEAPEHKAEEILQPSETSSLPGFLNFLSEDCADFLQFVSRLDHYPAFK